MSSLIDKANNGNNFGALEKKNHWKYDWYAPTRPETSTGNSSNLATDGSPSSDSESTEKYPFKFKTWVKSKVPVFLEQADNETSDIFDLSLYSTKTSSEINDKTGSNANVEGTNNDSLTVEDIRGAVGNSESIPGLSSAGTATNAENPVAENSKAEQPVIPTTEVDRPEAIKSGTSEHKTGVDGIVAKDVQTDGTTQVGDNESQQMTATKDVGESQQAGNKDAEGDVNME